MWQVRIRQLSHVHNIQNVYEKARPSLKLVLGFVELHGDVGDLFMGEGLI